MDQKLTKREQEYLQALAGDGGWVPVIGAYRLVPNPPQDETSAVKPLRTLQRQKLLEWTKDTTTWVSGFLGGKVKLTPEGLFRLQHREN